jgi:hypothetical protein
MSRPFGQRISILLFFTFFASGKLAAQTIEIRSDTIFINSKMFTQRTTAKGLQEILGKADRSSTLESTIWTYDALGLRIYLDPATQKITSVEFDLVKGEFGFSPKNIFHGRFAINGRQIDRSSSVAALKQIKEIGFHHTVLDMYQGAIAGATLTFTISDDTHLIDGVAISYSTDH